MNTNCWYVNMCDDAGSDCEMCQLFLEMNWQMQNSGLPVAKQKPIKLKPETCDIEAFNNLSEIRRDVDEFIDNGNNLYLCSKYTGNGKTSWAIKMLQSYFNLRCEGNYEHLLGMFVSTPQLLLKLKDFSNPVSAMFKQNLVNVDVVVWDDIAVSGMSTYDYTQLFTYIDGRLLSEKSNIFTSNCSTREELEKIVGNKLASRIWDTSYVVTLFGKDRRE